MKRFAGKPAAALLGAILLACLLPGLDAAAKAADVANQETVWQGKTLPQWVEQLSGETDRVRWFAAYALGQIGPDAAVAVDPLCKLLADRAQYEYVRGAAAWALGRIGDGSPQVVDLLIAMLRSDHDSVRRNSARALGNLGPAARDAADPLAAMFNDKDGTTRVEAALACWKLDQRPDARRALIEEASRRDVGAAAYQAAVALQYVGPDDPAAVAALVATLGHPDPDVRRAAARSLGRIGPAVIPALKDPLQGADPEVRRSAAEALGWVGSKATPALVVVLKNEDPAVRRAAARALGRLGPDAKTAEAALVEAVGDRDRQVQEAAAWALRKVRSAAAGNQR